MSKPTKQQLESSRLLLSIFVGFIAGALYITFIGNIPIIPDLAYYLIENEIWPAYVLYPLPFFPIIAGIGYGIFIEAFPSKEE